MYPSTNVDTYVYSSGLGLLFGLGLLLCKQTNRSQTKAYFFFQVGPCKMKGALSLVKAPPIFFENGSIEMESGNVSKSFIFPKTEAQNVQKLCPSRYLMKSKVLKPL